MTPTTHHTRARLDKKISQTREKIVQMEHLVHEAIAESIGSVNERDPKLAKKVIDSDTAINELQEDVRTLCFNTILTQAPVARDLREILGDLHMAAELERMGDHCKSIAKIALELSELPVIDVESKLASMAKLVAHQVHGIRTAQENQDVKAARAVAASDGKINELYRKIFAELVDCMAKDSGCVVQATHLILVALHLERIGDRVTNVAEDLVFLETGQTEELG